MLEYQTVLYHKKPIVTIDFVKGEVCVNIVL